MSQKRFLLGLSLAAMLASAATAGVISIDLPANVTDPAMTAGVVPAANWNNTPYQAQWLPLVDNTGTTMSATFYYDSPDGDVIAWSSTVAFANEGDNTIMRGHAYIVGDTTVDFADIPYDEYDVYVYYNSGAVYNHQNFSIGDQSVLAGDAPDGDQGGPDSEYVESAYAYDAGGFACENGNYIVLTGITGASFTLNATPDTDRGSIYTYISGIQIVESTQVTRIPGDANLDGNVDVSDLGILATNYNAGSGLEWGDADFTGDGLVDVSDLGILATNYGTTTSPQAVPEPSMAVMLCGVVWLFFFRGRVRR